MKGHIQHSTFNAQRPMRRCTRRFIGYRQAGLRLLNVGCWMFLSIALFASSLPAQTSSKNMLPPLSPAYGEMQPTFWERYGTKILIGGLEYAALAGLLAWVICRPRPRMIVPPNVQAREALKNLLPQPENGKVLSEVSQILQHYIIAAFRFPPGEMTTGEFSAALAQNKQIGAELAQDISSFLRQCDEWKFSKADSSQPINAVQRGLELISRAETWRLASPGYAQPPPLPIQNR
jgi:hypothetical protein